MPKSVYVVVILALITGLTFSQELVFRSGIIILRNNEMLKGAIALSQYGKANNRIPVLAQGSNHLRLIQVPMIQKIDLIYGNTLNLFNQAAQVNVWATLYLHSGEIIAQAFLDPLSVWLKSEDGKIQEFLIYDGMQTIENVNIIKGIFFIPQMFPLPISASMDDFSPEHNSMNSSVIKPQTKKSRSVIYFRKTPGGRQIGKLDRGISVNVIDRNGDWEKVRFEGWIHSPLLEPED